MRTGTTVRRVALLAGLTAAAWPDGVWAQLDPIQRVEASTALTSTDFKQITATCPPGTIAFSGGGGPAGGTDPNLPIILHQSLPQGNPPTGWHVLAQEQTPTAALWALTSVALCAAVPGYELVEASSPIDSATAKTIAADCPPGKVPIGGGGGIFFFTPDLALIETLPSEGTGWRAAGHESTGTSANWAVNVKVNCAPTVDVVGFRAFTSGETGRDDLFLICPPGRTAIGGGASTTLFSAITSTEPGSSDSAWNATGRRVGGSSSWSLGGAVVCYRSPVFFDGFESGDTGAWSGSVP